MPGRRESAVYAGSWTEDSVMRGEEGRKRGGRAVREDQEVIDE